MNTATQYNTHLRRSSDIPHASNNNGGIRIGVSGNDHIISHRQTHNNITTNINNIYHVPPLETKNCITAHTFRLEFNNINKHYRQKLPPFQDLMNKHNRQKFLTENDPSIKQLIDYDKVRISNKMTKNYASYLKLKEEIQQCKDAFEQCKITKNKQDNTNINKLKSILAPTGTTYTNDDENNKDKDQDKVNNDNNMMTQETQSPKGNKKINKKNTKSESLDQRIFEKYSKKGIKKLIFKEPINNTNNTDNHQIQKKGAHLFMQVFSKKLGNDFLDKNTWNQNHSKPIKQTKSDGFRSLSPRKSTARFDSLSNVWNEDAIKIAAAKIMEEDQKRVIPPKLDDYYFLMYHDLIDGYVGREPTLEQFQTILNDLQKPKNETGGEISIQLRKLKVSQRIKEISEEIGKFNNGSEKQINYPILHARPNEKRVSCISLKRRSSLFFPKNYQPGNQLELYDSNIFIDMNSLNKIPDSINPLSLNNNNLISSGNRSNEIKDIDDHYNNNNARQHQVEEEVQEVEDEDKNDEINEENLKLSNELINDLHSDISLDCGEIVFGKDFNNGQLSRNIPNTNNNITNENEGLKNDKGLLPYLNSSITSNINEKNYSAILASLPNIIRISPKNNFKSKNENNKKNPFEVLNNIKSKRRKQNERAISLFTSKNNNDNEINKYNIDAPMIATPTPTTTISPKSSSLKLLSSINRKDGIISTRRFTTSEFQKKDIDTINDNYDDHINGNINNDPNNQCKNEDDNIPRNVNALQMSKDLKKALKKSLEQVKKELCVFPLDQIKTNKAKEMNINMLVLREMCKGEMRNNNKIKRIICKREKRMAKFFDKIQNRNEEFQKHATMQTNV